MSEPIKPDPDTVAARLAAIEAVVRKFGLKGNPRRFIVLHGWNRISDWDLDYELNLPEVPDPAPVGMMVWYIYSSDGPDLAAARVISSTSSSILLREVDRDITAMVERERVYVTPIPFRAFPIRRHELALYLGEELAAEWHRRRHERHQRWQQENP